MNIKKYLLHFINNFILTFLIFFLYSYSNNEPFLAKNYNYIFLFILLFSTLILIIKTDKKSNIRNLDQKIRKYFLAFFYTIILVYIISILFHHNQMLNFSIFLNLIVLLLVLTISNIYISSILIRKININIIPGRKFNFFKNSVI